MQSPACSICPTLCLYAPVNICHVALRRETAEAWEKAFLKLAKGRLSRLVHEGGLRLAFSAERSVADELARVSALQRCSASPNHRRVAVCCLILCCIVMMCLLWPGSTI